MGILLTILSLYLFFMLTGFILNFQTFSHSTDFVEWDFS